MIWVSVTEDTPMPLQDVLVYGRIATEPRHEVQLGYRRPDGTWWLSGADELQLVRVTHWMRLPAPPTNGAPPRVAA